MRFATTLLVGGAILSSIAAAFAQEVDWQKVDDAFGRKAVVVAGDVQNNSAAKSSHRGATTVAPHFEAHSAQAPSPSSGGRSMVAGQ